MRWVPIGINLLFLARVEVTLLTQSHTHAQKHTMRVLWNDNDIWLNTVTNVISSFQENHEPVTMWWRKTEQRQAKKNEAGELGEGRGGEGKNRMGEEEWEVKNKKTQTWKVHRQPNSPHAEWQRNVRSCRSTPPSLYPSVTFSPSVFSSFPFVLKSLSPLLCLTPPHTSSPISFYTLPISPLRWGLSGFSCNCFSARDNGL